MSVLLYIVAFYIVVFLTLGASVTAGIFLTQFAVVPLIFRYSKKFQRSLVFSNMVQWPFRVDFDNPSASGVEGGRNLTIEFHSKVDNCPIKIGVWHVLPKTVYERLRRRLEVVSDKEELTALFDIELANSKNPIMLYCHGNSNSRASNHRLVLYNFFQKLDFHTIALDYRGYGDSTPVSPSEDGVVEDALMVYQWLVTTLAAGPKSPPVFVWGHSLGTGISAHVLGNLEFLSKSVLARRETLPPPNGLILESPFSTLSDEIEYHSIAKLMSWLPYFHACFVTPFNTQTHAFRTKTHLAQAKDIPVLILHARDDFVVPHVLGEMLYKSLQESRSGGGATLILHSFDECEKLGHKGICHARGLDKIVSDFVSAHQGQSRSSNSLV